MATATARICACLVAAALAGCSASEPSVLTRTDPASPADCAYGGRVVASGYDANRNGDLDDDEVAVRTAVCNPALVVRMQAEPPGANCAHGGTAVQSGIDASGNGALDDAEVAHTDYLCRGALATRIEVAGARCREAGIAIDAGPDLDGNGVLDDAEVARTELVCGDVVPGDVVIHSDAEAAALAPIRIITGSLTVQVTALLTVSLPNLLHIGGSLRVLDNAQLSQLSLPALQAVDGDIVLRADGLQMLDLSHLGRAGSLDLEMLSLASLTGLATLAAVDGAVVIGHMPSLATIALPEATSVGDVSITDNALLTQVTWDVSDQIGDIAIANNGRLATIELSLNTFFDGPDVGAVSVTDNPVLHRIALLADQVDSFAIGGDPQLTSIELQIDTVVHDVALVDITSPFNLITSDGYSNLRDIGGDLTISGPAVSFDLGGGVNVRGRFTLDGTKLSSLARFDNSLRVVGSLRVTNNANLTKLTAFALIGDLEVSHNAALTTIDLEDVLASELGAIKITDNPVLSSAPAIGVVARVHGAVDIERNPMLGAVFGPNLVRLEGPVTIHDNAALTDLVFPQLGFVAGSFDVSLNTALQTFVLPALPDVAGALSIDSNPQLHHIDLTSLASADLFQVDGNARLPTCEVLAVFGHTAGPHEQSGNGDAATCGP